MADGRKATWASGGLFVESGETTIRPPQLSTRGAKHEVHRCCPRRARHVHDSRSYTDAPRIRAPNYEPHRVSWAELSIAAKLFGGLFECLRGVP